MKRILEKLESVKEAIQKTVSKHEPTEIDFRKQILKAIANKDETLIEKIFSELSEPMRCFVLNPTEYLYKPVSSNEDPFIYAILQGLTATVKNFIKYISTDGFNRKTSDLFTALHAACHGRSKEIFQLLLAQQNIDVNARAGFLLSTPLQTLITNLKEFGENENLAFAARMLIRDPRSQLDIQDETHLNAYQQMQLFILQGKFPQASAEFLENEFLKRSINAQPQSSADLTKKTLSF